MKQRTLNLILVGSITLNAFLLGVIGMHVFSRRGVMHERKGWGGDSANAESIAEQRGPRLLRGLVRAAGGPQDPRVKALWAGRRQQLGPVREHIDGARQRVEQRLVQEPFDREALRQALAEALAARHRADELANEGVLQLAEQLTPEERAGLRRPRLSSPPPGRP